MALRSIGFLALCSIFFHPLGPVYASDTTVRGTRGATISKVFVLGHTHVDIGFDFTPDETREWSKTVIDSQLAYSLANDDFVWNIEGTWMLQNWIDRSSPVEIETLMRLVRSKRIGIGATHSSLRTGKAGFEEVTRLLWNARHYRREYGISLHSAFVDDVPGTSWAYPQILAKAGVRYLVAGCNMFIGGAFDQPYSSYVFWWEGPDGSRVLTRSTLNNYEEGIFAYGFLWVALEPLRDGRIDGTILRAKLNELTTAGYPYDAVLVQLAKDAYPTRSQLSMVRTWNVENDDIEVILGVPEDFFSHIEEHYSDQIPVHRGDWTTLWDVYQIFAPQSEMMVKNAQDTLLTAEKMNGFASILSEFENPVELLDEAWDNVLNMDEHSGAGPSNPGRFTQIELNALNAQHRDHALRAHEATFEAYGAGQAALLATLAGRGGGDTVVVFNPLSWTRTAAAEILLPPNLEQSGAVLDESNGEELPLQYDPIRGTAVFMVYEVPGLGMKTYRLLIDTPRENTGFSEATSIENSRYRLEVAPSGELTSFFDHEAQRELVRIKENETFNGYLLRDNRYAFGQSNFRQLFSGTPDLIWSETGPVFDSIYVDFGEDFPISFCAYRLYHDVDQVTILDTLNRAALPFTSRSENSKHGSIIFPFALTETTARYDTAAGWLDPAKDTLKGSYTGMFAVQHGVDISEAEYGVLIGTPDVYSHAVKSNGTVFSNVLRYVDEALLEDGSIGTVSAEPGAPDRWSVRYIFRPHRRAFDPERESLTAWETATPLVAMIASGPRSAGAEWTGESLLSIDASNVIAVAIKGANNGDGAIVKLHEIGGQSTGAVIRVHNAIPVGTTSESTPLEDYGPHLGAAGQRVFVTLDPWEIKTIRLFGCGQQFGSLSDFEDGTFGDWRPSSGMDPGQDLFVSNGELVAGFSDGDGHLSELSFGQGPLVGDFEARVTIDFDDFRTNVAGDPEASSVGIVADAGAIGHTLHVVFSGFKKTKGVDLWVVEARNENSLTAHGSLSIPSGTDTVTLQIERSGSSLLYLADFHDSRGPQEIAEEEVPGAVRLAAPSGWTGANGASVHLDDFFVLGLGVCNLPEELPVESEGPEGGTCFIATAAYGTPMADEIFVLRGFRDSSMLNNPLGLLAVDTYYRLSPPVAQRVSLHPALAHAIRAALTPVLFLMKLKLFTFLPILAFILLAGSGLVIASWCCGLLPLTVIPAQAGISRWPIPLLQRRFPPSRE